MMMRESVLYYNPGDKKKEMQVKGVLVRMGIRIHNVRPEQTNQTIGRLLGEEKRELENREQERKEPEDQEAEELRIIEDEILVLHNFSGRRLDELLLNLRKSGVPRINLKAVVTETNIGWPFYQLYQEIQKEHELMHRKPEEKA